MAGARGRTAAEQTAKKAPPAAVEPAKKAAANKVAAKKVAAKKVAAKKVAAKKVPAKKVPAKKVAAKGAPAKKAAAVKQAPVTTPDLTEIRARLQQELAELQQEYQRAVTELDTLQRSLADGAGDDLADAGSKTFEREQEQSIAANRQQLMTQLQHAIERIDSGTYGICEDCGRPIPPARLMALPMATLDAACKARAERR
jgi:DnaK suppressor protein